jgi:hypothetical protein
MARIWSAISNTAARIRDRLQSRNLTLTINSATYASLRRHRHALGYVSCDIHPPPRIEATNMGKGNHSQTKEKKKPKKAAAPKAVPVKSAPPPKKP